MAGEKDGRPSRRWSLGLWCVWMTALIAVPIFQQNPDVAGGLHSLAALGLAAGLGCSRLARRPFVAGAGRIVLRASVLAGLALTFVNLALSVTWWACTGIWGYTVQNPLVLSMAWWWTQAVGLTSAFALLESFACGLALWPCLRAAGVADEPVPVPLRPLARALVVLFAAAALRPYAWFGIALTGFDLPMGLLLTPAGLTWGALAALCCRRVAGRLARAGGELSGAHLMASEGTLLALLVGALCAGELAGKWANYATSLTPWSLSDLAISLDLPYEAGGFVPWDVVSIISFALYGLTAAALAVLPAALARVRRRPEGAAGPASAEGEGELAALLARGLTQREAQAVQALLDGLSSREAAVRLGLGPSTVRNYQQRAYRKLGVSDARGACELLADERRPEASAPRGERSSAPAEGGAAAPAAASVARRVAAAALACFLLLPLGSGGSLAWWVSGQVAVCVAGGLALAAALFALDALRARGVLVDGRAAWGADRAAHGALLASCAATTACRLVLLLGGPWVSDLVFRLVMAAAVPTFVALSLRRAARALAGRRGALALVARAGLGAPWALALVCLALALAAAVWEELWRASVWTDFSLFPQAAPFLAAVLGTCAALVWLRLGREARAVSAASLPASLAVLALEGWEVAAFLCALLNALALALGLSRRPGAETARRGEEPLVAALLCASGAAGACLGVVVVNLYASIFTVERHMFQDGYFDYERLIAFTSSASYVMGAVFLVCGCALVAAVWHLVRSVDASRLMEGVRVAPERRLRAFLVSRGLSELQVDVALLTAEGLSTREIANRLHYAPGTVGSARVACYQALGIHDRAQLAAVLSGVVG